MREQAIVAVYSHHNEAERAVRKLDEAGFDMKKLSIVGRGFHTEEEVQGYFTTGDRMMTWGKFGAFWGAVWGFLIGSAFFIIPGLGPVLVGGPLVAAIAGAVEGAVLVGGVSALVAGLVSLGVPEHEALKYETRVRADSFLLVARGLEEEIRQARVVLSDTNGEALEVYEAEAETVGA